MGLGQTVVMDQHSPRSCVERIAACSLECRGLGNVGFPASRALRANATGLNGRSGSESSRSWKARRLQVETDDRWRCQFENCRRAVRALPEAVRTLLFDRLCLTDLTSHKMSRICGADLVPADDRRAAGLTFTASEVIENPYLIVEQYAPPDDDPIPFDRIDNGIFLPQTRGGASIPGIEEFTSNDRRAYERRFSTRCERRNSADTLSCHSAM